LSVKNRPVRPSRERANPFNREENHKYITDPVFLIGNGTSRKDFDLERLRGVGTIVGCNALYRDFAPDLLIAIDAKLITEIKKSNYWEDHAVFLPGNRAVTMKNALTWRTDRFNTSGCFGMKMISQLLKPKVCYMLGMDGFPGNIYDKTLNYAPNTLQNFSGVVSFYMKALQGEGDTVFVNVNEKDAWPKEAKDTGKYECISYEEFEKILA
jgi:hypothetical protein